MIKTKSFNEILLRRRNKLNVQAMVDSNNNNLDRVIIMMKNINDLGYTFSKSLIEYLAHITVDEQNELYKELVSCLKEYTGANKTWQPMYPNFPKEVEEMEDFELFINAIVHYLSGGTLVPDYEKDERLPLFESPDLIVLDHAEDEELDVVMNNLITSKTSLSETDKEDMIWLIQNKGLKNENLPEEIPFKENVAIICSLILDNTTELEWYSVLHKYLKTATDILRFVTYLSGGDVSLASNTKYKSLSRKKRRLILRLLDTCGNIEEDMLRHEMKWIRVGEILHPGEYDEYKNVNIAFDKLRNNGKIETFGGKANKYYEEKEFDKLIPLLKTRPGEFARKLDSLLRLANNDGNTINNIINSFKEVSDKISVPVLLQIKEHFAWRNEENDSRVFFPKGQLAKCYTIKNELDNITEEYCVKIVEICNNSIINQMKEKESLGKVYIDDSIKGYCVPQSQRSASKSMKPITRNSRLPISKDTKSCRGFIWWTNVSNNSSNSGYSWNIPGRVDIDLSAAILDENFRYLSHISYTNLRDIKFRGYHSGDIVNGGSMDGKGVCEFIDVDIDSVVNNGGRYIIYQVYSFTGQKYSDMPNVMFGWMERQDVNSGEIFEASTVEQRIDLTAETTVAIPVLFDCVNKEFIWMDVAGNINGMNISCANLERNLSGVSAMCYGIVKSHKPQMYDLAVLNAMARGTIVTNRDEADTIFDMNTEKPVIKLEKYIEIQNEKGEVIGSRIDIEEKIKECRIITAWDIDCWMSEMM